MFLFTHSRWEEIVTPKKGRSLFLIFKNILKSTERISVIGRFFAMDRDERWEKLKKSYDLLVNGVGVENPKY